MTQATQTQAEEARGDRRPVAARNRRIFHAVAARLARAGVAPNAISLASIALSIVAAGLMLYAAWSGLTPLARVALFAAGVCVQLRLVCNLLDGLVAIEGGRGSPVGELYNEAPDRVSDLLTLLGFGALVSDARLFALGVGAGAMAVLVAYVRALGKSAGARQHFCGPMAKQMRMTVVTAALALLAVLPPAWTHGWGRVGDAPLGLVEFALVAIILGCVVACWRRLMRIANDLRAKAVAAR